MSFGRILAEHEGDLMIFFQFVLVMILGDSHRVDPTHLLQWGVLFGSVGLVDCCLLLPRFLCKADPSLLSQKQP